MTTDLLSNARQDINQIDQEMAKLFEKRMVAVKDVITYKMAHDLPIFDETREAKVIEQNLAKLQNKAYEKYYRDFIQAMMDISKSYQQDLKILANKED